MSDISKRAPDCDDDGGERGRRGHRGHRGRDGRDGATGPTGPAASSTGFTGPTGPTGSDGSSRLIAAANVSGAGTQLSGFGFSGVNHVGVGQYDLTLSAPPANDVDVIPTVSMQVLVGFIDAGPVIGGVIRVSIRAPNVTLDPLDSPFYIHVVNGAA
jgi:hypothetical protein